MSEEAKPPARGKLIETGSFRVDRERALARVRDYQVPCELHPLLLFIRAAVAAGAGRVAVTQKRRLTELRFDGRPFAADELDFPFAGLFAEETARDKRLSSLAFALLRALRESPKRIGLSSGSGAGRFRLELRTIDEFFFLKPVAAPAADTVLRVEWGAAALAAGGPLALAPERIALACALSPATIAVDGREVVETPRSLPEPVNFDAEGVRGGLNLPNRRESAREGLELFSFGVRVCSVAWPGRELPAAARVNDDSLRLNASLAGVILDERFDRLAGILRREMKRLLPHAASGHRERLALLGERLLKEPPLRAFWRAELIWSDFEPEPEGLLAALKADGRLPGASPRPQGSPLAVLETAYRTLWLRRACDFYRIPRETEPGDPDLNSLRQAPVVLNESGFPLSIWDLHRESQTGRILYTYEPDPEYPGREAIVWCLEDADRLWLLGRFPEALER